MFVCLRNIAAILDSNYDSSHKQLNLLVINAKKLKYKISGSISWQLRRYSTFILIYEPLSVQEVRFAFFDEGDEPFFGVVGLVVGGHVLAFHG